MNALNDEKVIEAIVIALGAILVIWAIVIAVNIWIDHSNQKKQAEEALKEKERNNKLQNNALELGSINDNSFNNVIMNMQGNRQDNIQNAIYSGNMQENQSQINNSNMQMAYAQAGITQFTQFEPEQMSTFNEGIKEVNNGFYTVSNHFTDTGRSGLRGDYANASMGAYNDVNFVIIKSVISTETREEID